MWSIQNAPKVLSATAPESFDFPAIKSKGAFSSTIDSLPSLLASIIGGSTKLYLTTIRKSNSITHKVARHGPTVPRSSTLQVVLKVGAPQMTPQFHASFTLFRFLTFDLGGSIEHGYCKPLTCLVASATTDPRKEAIG